MPFQMNFMNRRVHNEDVGWYKMSVVVDRNEIIITSVVTTYTPYYFLTFIYFTSVLKK